MARDLARMLVQDRPHGYEVLGFLPEKQSRVGYPVVNPTFIGTVDQLFELPEQHLVQTISGSKP